MLVNFNGNKPSKAHPDDAAFDLRASECMRIPTGSWATVPTGTRIAIPEGHVGKVCPRSGLAAKHGISVLNAPGIIDPGYTGEIKVVLINHSLDVFEINAGDRIAQLLIEEVPEVELLDVAIKRGTERGDNGFGSTGVK